MRDGYDQEYRDVFVELLVALKEKIGVIVAAASAAALIGFGISSLWITPQYEASVNMIVNTRMEASATVTNDNIASAQNLVDTYAVIIKSNVVLKQVIGHLGLDMSCDELSDQVSVSAINNTQVMKISAQSDDPQTAVQIVEAIAQIAPDIVVEAVEAGSCKVVSDVEVGEEPVSPNVTKNTLIAGSLGMLVCTGVIVLLELLKDQIADSVDVERKLDLAALGVIPEVAEAGEKKASARKSTANGARRILSAATGDMSFAYAEAYKALRTNLEYMSAADGGTCFLLTSAVQDESKTTTAINLAGTLARGGKSVIVVECDLRKPTMRRYLKLERGRSGLSAVLTNKAALEDCIFSVNDLGISVLHAGRIPENPSELLSQRQMGELIRVLKQNYDYVLLDAPPISVVTDAAVVGRRADGALLVVRSRFAPARVVRQARKRLEAVNVRVLGAVLTRFDAKKSGWRYGYDYRKYTDIYGYGKNKA